MAGHAQLKFVMTECSKTQIRLARPNLFPHNRSGEFQFSFYDSSANTNTKMYFTSVVSNGNFNRGLFSMA